MSLTGESIVNETAAMVFDVPIYVAGVNQLTFYFRAGMAFITIF